MRTTLEIPDDLFRRAKSKSALLGISLKDYISSALERELESPARRESKSRRVKLPLIHSKKPGMLRLTNAEIEDLLD
jgi:hypothetical protein